MGHHCIAQLQSEHRCSERGWWKSVVTLARVTSYGIDRSPQSVKQSEFSVLIAAIMIYMVVVVNIDFGTARSTQGKIMSPILLA